MKRVLYTSGSAARKHNANDHMQVQRARMGLHPLVGRDLWGWGEEAQSSVSRLAARLALQLQCSKSKATTDKHIPETEPDLSLLQC